MKVGCERKKGGGRKTKDPEMEKDLYKWYLENKREDRQITARMVKERAIELTTCPDFIASKGWLDKFKIRYNLDIAKETSSCNIYPKSLKPKTEEPESDSDDRIEKGKVKTESD